MITTTFPCRGMSYHLKSGAVVPPPTVVSPAPAPVTPSAPTTSILPRTAQDQTPDNADNPIDHVIAISIDGLNPAAISKLGKSRIAAFHRLMREGSYTLNARTDREKTSTLPNHTTMLTGRPVSARRGGHGYTGNFDNGGTIHRAAGHCVASVFDVVHDHGGSTAVFAAKTKFRIYSAPGTLMAPAIEREPMTVARQDRSVHHRP